MKLLNIPSWMEPIILQLTGGNYTSIEQLKKDCDDVENGPFHGMVGAINSIINTVEALHQLNLLKISSRKPISEVQMGEVFKIYENQERYFIKDSTNIKEGNMYSIRELHGGKGFVASWLSAEDKCHADIDVLVVPNLPSELYKP